MTFRHIHISFKIKSIFSQSYIIISYHFIAVQFHPYKSDCLAELLASESFFKSVSNASKRPVSFSLVALSFSWWSNDTWKSFKMITWNDELSWIISPSTQFYRSEFLSLSGGRFRWDLLCSPIACHVSSAPGRCRWNWRYKFQAATQSKRNRSFLLKQISDQVSNLLAKFMLRIYHRHAWIKEKRSCIFSISQLATAILMAGRWQIQAA